MLELFIGKPLGILVLTAWAVKFQCAEPPQSVSWLQLAGAGLLAGIGFMMSMFISILAAQDQAPIDLSKVAILIASTVSAINGLIWIRSAVNV